MILKNKYKIDFHEWAGDDVKGISIFTNWIRFFDALNVLRNQHTNGLALNESDFQTPSNIQKLFISLHDEHRGIFDYQHEIRFDLFHILKQSLEIYDQQVTEFGRNKFLQNLSNHAEYGQKFPVGSCLKFYSIFKQQLDSRYKESSSILENKHRLAVSQSEIYELYKRYGELCAVNVMYQLKLSNDLTSHDLIMHFNELHLIEQQIVSDDRLLKVLFKLEDDGQQGCFLNCILIYPTQALSNINAILRQLEQLSEVCASNVEMKFLNWGNMLSRISGEDVVGFIDSFNKLESFLYWTVGSFYRHDDFFHYHYPLMEQDGEFIHKQVLAPWSLNLQTARLGMKQRVLNISQSELISYISDPVEMWSTSILPAENRRRLEIDKIVLLELPYELGHLKQFNSEILYCLEVFHTFLNLGDEPFFYIHKFEDVITAIKPSQLGCQLIYLFNLLCQQPNVIQQIKEQNGFLGQRFQLHLNNQVLLALEQHSQIGSTALANIEILQQYNLLRAHHQPDQLSAWMPGFNINGVDHSISDSDDFIVYTRRTNDAQSYLESLLKQDQLICRFKFYAEVDGDSFVEKRETFSAHFTEFLRVHKRSDLLKDLNGYFLIWLNKSSNNQFVIQKKEPYVDIVFFVEPSYVFSFISFEQRLITAWKDYQGKKSVSAKHVKHFQTSYLFSENLMNTEVLLSSKIVKFEKKNKKMKKALLEKLLPYFTYRHFYLPKLYDVNLHKKIKMFSKGSAIQKKPSK